MKICECLLLLIIILLSFFVTITDMKYGLVKNRAVFLAGGLGAFINLFYYSVFAREFFFPFLLNLFVMSIISLLLYARHYWAAGDSKLLICLVFLIPGRLYDKTGSNIPGLNCLIMVFLVAYLYLICETVLFWALNKHVYRGRSFIFREIPSLIGNFVVVFCFLRVLSLIYPLVFKDFYNSNQILFSLIYFILVTIVSDARFAKNRIVIIFSTIFLFIILIAQGLKNELHPVALLSSNLVIILALLIRYFVSGYNYLEIPTEDVNPGMILSYATVFLFQGSLIKDLPHTTSEDMSDRISEAQAEAIKRWGISKKGRSRITIVRKMPFAAFICVGTILYIFVRMVL